MRSTSTKFWSKFTLTLVSPAKPWASWTRLWTTFSSASLAKHRAWLTTTRNQPSAPVRSRPPSDCFCPANWRNTLSVKEPKLWPNTPAASKLTGFSIKTNNGSFRSHQMLWKQWPILLITSITTWFTSPCFRRPDFLRLTQWNKVLNLRHLSLVNGCHLLYSVSSLFYKVKMKLVVLQLNIQYWGAKRIRNKPLSWLNPNSNPPAIYVAYTMTTVTKTPLQNLFSHYSWQIIFPSRSKCKLTKHKRIRNVEKRESLREFYRGHFCLSNLRFYTSVHKGRLHQQVCRATWKSILSQIFFREKNNV